jgi:hypothetical protein
MTIGYQTCSLLMMPKHKLLSTSVCNLHNGNVGLLPITICLCHYPNNGQYLHVVQENVAIHKNILVFMACEEGLVKTSL